MRPVTMKHEYNQFLTNTSTIDLNIPDIHEQLLFAGCIT